MIEAQTARLRDEADWACGDAMLCGAVAGGARGARSCIPYAWEKVDGKGTSANGRRVAGRAREGRDPAPRGEGEGEKGLGIGIGWGLCSLSREDLLYRTALTALHIKYLVPTHPFHVALEGTFSVSLCVCVCRGPRARDGVLYHYSHRFPGRRLDP